MIEKTDSLSKISIYSSNVNGFGDKHKRTGYFLHIKKFNPDIVLLSDTRLNLDKENQLRNEIEYNCYFNSYASNSRGVAILIKKNLPIKTTPIYNDDEGNILTVLCEVDSKCFTVSAIYGPNDDKPEFFDDLFSMLLTQVTPNAITGGDMNVTLDFQIDNYAYANPRNNRARKKLNEIIDDQGFFDAFRNFNKRKKEFTWKKNGGRQRARLDMFILSESMRPFLTSYMKTPPFRSDHDSILINIDFTKFVQGKGFWKHNNELLKDPDYLDRIKNSIRLTCAKYVILDGYENFFTEATENELQQFLNQPDDFYFGLNYSINPHMIFEMLLNDSRNESIAYSVGKRRAEMHEEKNLFTNMSESKQDVEGDPENPVLINIHEEKLIQYETFMEQKANKTVFGRGLKHKVEGERPTSFFMNLEKNRNAQRYISTLSVERGGVETTITSQEDIELEIKKYYEDLYASKENLITIEKIEDFMEGEDIEKNIPKLSEIEAEEIEGEISELEIKEVLRKTRNDSSPGSTGFTFAFYKMFWKNIKTFLINAMNFSFEIKKLPISQSRGVISIIPKGDKPKEYLDNWRPITMQNCFYKLLSGTIARRINNLLDLIIHKDQVGFVPGRYIGECIRTTSDIIEWAKRNNKTGLLLLVDFRKAFDSISFNFIKKALSFFGFKNNIIRWVEILLHGFTAQIIHAGNLSVFFEVLVGCRQGDPLAAPLFLLAIEILCIKLRSSNIINKFDMGIFKVLLSLYADDVSIFLRYSSESLRNAIYILEKFYGLSGLAIQKKKTQCVVFGRVPDGNIKLCPDISLKWSQEFELLGVKFDATLDKMDRNIEEKIIEMEKIMTHWKYRFLSPIGRVCIAKTLLLSKFSHIAFALPVLSKELIKKIEDKIYFFIWKGPDKVAREVAKKAESKGGLNFPDLLSSWRAFKISWFRRLLSSNATWADIFEHNLSKIHRDIDKKSLIYKCGTFITHQISNRFPNKFWAECLKIWKPSMLDLLAQCPEDFLTFPIWGSHIFMQNKKCCNPNNFKSLYDKISYPIDIMKASPNGSTCFLTNDEMISRYSDFNVNEFLSIKLVISNAAAHLRFNLANNRYETPIRPIGAKLVNMNQKGCNNWVALFKKKSSNNLKVVERERKWEVDLGRIQGVFFWDRCYSNVKSIFFDNRLKIFYYNIVRGILKTNRIISKFVPEISENCTFCNTEKETILHLFWECNVVKAFINLSQESVGNILPEIMHNLSRNGFIFGRADKPIYEIKNLFAIYLKYYIWIM